MQMAKTKTKIRPEFDYLNRLRESGTTNMFGAVPYLMDEFDIERDEAREVLLDWMQWVEENPSNRDL
jgi:hypothetical protein